MKTPSPLSVAALSFLALAACKQQPTVIEPTDPMKNAVAAAPPVQLPPSISATVLFRCKDQSVVTIDFFKGHKQLTLHPTKSGEPVHLVAAVEGGPYTAAGGYVLTGDEKKIAWKDAQKPEMTCHV